VGLYSSLARPLVFRLPAEASHGLAVASLQAGPFWSLAGPLLSAGAGGRPADICGVRVPNAVGIAAGFDKDCRVVGPLLAIGFGFATAGTVTRGPRPGNARPRLLRDTRARAIVNSMGFPGRGLDAAERRLRTLNAGQRSRTFVSISGTVDDEVVECHARLEPLVCGVEVNISSPNTAGLRVYQEPGRLRQLVTRLASTARKPLLIKLPRGDWDGEGRTGGGGGRDRTGGGGGGVHDGGGGGDETARVLALARAAVDAGARGLVVANTRPVADARLAAGRGGLSGAPLFDSTLRLVEAVRRAVPAGVSVVGCGGVFSGRDAARLIDAGASGVQLYTAFVYEGPGLPGRIARHLARRQYRARR
jgi:dihydroorotate dehydrogenase